MNGISGHDAAGLISHWGSTTKYKVPMSVHCHKSVLVLISPLMLLGCKATTNQQTHSSCLTEQTDSERFTYLITGKYTAGLRDLRRSSYIHVWIHMSYISEALPLRMCMYFTIYICCFIYYASINGNVPSPFPSIILDLLWQSNLLLINWTRWSNM